MALQELSNLNGANPDFFNSSDYIHCNQMVMNKYELSKWLAVNMSNAEYGTFKSLLSHGFNLTQSLAAAKVFGSDVDLAMDTMLYGVSKHPSSHKKEPIKSCIRHAFIEGYLRQLMNDFSFYIPFEIRYLILFHSNLHFVQLNCNIYGIEDKYFDELTIPRVLAVRGDETLREAAHYLEREYVYNGYKNTNNVYVHFWARRSVFTKSIYPIEDDLSPVQMTDIDSAWIKLGYAEDIAMAEYSRFVSTEKNEPNIELGVEIYDACNRKWPFLCHKQNMKRTKAEIATEQDIINKLMKNSKKRRKIICNATI